MQVQIRKQRKVMPFLRKHLSLNVLFSWNMNTVHQKKGGTAVRSGTGSILWAMGIGLLFWVGGKDLLPL